MTALSVTVRRVSRPAGAHPLDQQVELASESEGGCRRYAGQHGHNEGGSPSEEPPPRALGLGRVEARGSDRQEGHAERLGEPRRGRGFRLAPGDREDPIKPSKQVVSGAPDHRSKQHQTQDRDHKPDVEKEG